jgi:phospholipid/cholesterol/gamma-HCH transport system substrate-binding protein
MSMEGRGYALVVGIFVIALTAALVAAAMWLSQDRTAYLRYTVVSRLAVTGLQAEAAVKLRGVTVGRVETIRFDPNDPNTILVGIAVAKGTPIQTSTYAQLGYQGITGLTYVKLDDDPSAAARGPMRPDQHIVMRASLFDRLAAAGPDLVDKLDVVLERAGDLFDEGNRQTLARSVASVGRTAERFGALADRLKSGAAQIEPLAADARITLQNANEALQRIAALSDDLQRRAQALDEVGRAASQVTAVGKAVEAAVPRVERLVDELSRNSRSVDRLLADLKAQPQSLLLGRTPAEPGPGEPGFKSRAGRRQ